VSPCLFYNLISTEEELTCARIITAWVAAISITVFPTAKRGGALPKAGYGHETRYNHRGPVIEYDFRPELSAVPKAYQRGSAV